MNAGGWALVNVGVSVLMIVGMYVTCRIQDRLNRKQLERLEKEWGFSVIPHPSRGGNAEENDRG